MTAHYIARVVQSLYDKINIDEMNAEFNGIRQRNDCGRLSDEWVNKHITNKVFFRWLLACSLLEEHLYKNFTTFEETELVYRWAKKICDNRNNLRNLYRAYGNPWYKQITFAEWLKKNKFGR